jgi:hypothetical protein
VTTPVSVAPDVSIAPVAPEVSVVPVVSVPVPLVSAVVVSGLSYKNLLPVLTDDDDDVYVPVFSSPVVASALDTSGPSVRFTPLVIG